MFDNVVLSNYRFISFYTYFGLLWSCTYGIKCTHNLILLKGAVQWHEILSDCAIDFEFLNTVCYLAEKEPSS